MARPHAPLLLLFIALASGCRRSTPSQRPPVVTARVDATSVVADARAATADIQPPSDVLAPAEASAPRAVHPLIASLRGGLLALVPPDEAAEIQAVDVSDTDRGDERQMTYLLWDLTLRRLLPAATYGASWRLAPIVDFASLQQACEAVYDEEWRMFLNENAFGYQDCQSDSCSQEAVRKAGCNSPGLERVQESAEAFLAAEGPSSADAGDAAATSPGPGAERVGRVTEADGATRTLLDGWQLSVVTELFRPRSEGCRRPTAMAAETLWEIVFAARHGRRAHVTDRRSPDAGFPGDGSLRW